MGKKPRHFGQKNRAKYLIFTKNQNNLNIQQNNIQNYGNNSISQINMKREFDMPDSRLLKDYNYYILTQINNYLY